MLRLPPVCHLLARLLLLGLWLLPACSDDTEPNAPDAGHALDGSMDAESGDAALDAASDATADAANDDDAGSDAGARSVTSDHVTLIEMERAVELTPDGSRALLWRQSTGGLYFYDTATGMMELKTTLDDTDLTAQMPLALSADGHIAAIYGFQPEQAGVWSEATGWTRLGTLLDGCADKTMMPPVYYQLGGAFDLTPDANVVVGLLWVNCGRARAFRWSNESGGRFTLLQELGDGTGSSRASGVSADGNVIVGWAAQGGVDRSPAVWAADGTGFLLDPNDTTAPGELKVVTPDGRLAAGDWANQNGGISGFVWTQADGVTRFTTSTPDFDDLTVNAVTSNGQHVFGKLTHREDVGGLIETTFEGAFVWSQEKGLRNLIDAVSAAGVTLADGLAFDNVMSVSADGSVILGVASIAAPPDDLFGFPSYKLFVLKIPSGTLD